MGLVVATMLSVGAVAHEAIGPPWPAAFVLGAVVSPTDPIAATSIGAKLRRPAATVAIIEGESLVNDGTALVLFKFAVIAVVTGSFSLGKRPAASCGTSSAASASDWSSATSIRRVRRRIDNPPLEVTLAFLTGYFAFLPASSGRRLGSARRRHRGVYLGWYTPELTSVESRLTGAGSGRFSTFS